jgi:hypothetical protein
MEEADDVDEEGRQVTGEVAAVRDGDLGGSDHEGLQLAAPSMAATCRWSAFLPRRGLVIAAVVPGEAGLAACAWAVAGGLVSVVVT